MPWPLTAGRGLTPVWGETQGHTLSSQEFPTQLSPCRPDSEAPTPRPAPQVKHKANAKAGTCPRPEQDHPADTLACALHSDNRGTEGTSLQGMSSAQQQL